MSNQLQPVQTSWPTELRLSKDKRTLRISFEDGTSYDLAAEYLRVESPSAEVQGHGPNQKKTIAGKINIEILSIVPVGHYAVKLVFDDMHDTGIYGWDTLAAMGRNYPVTWQAYLDNLALAGLTRDPSPGRTK